MIIVQNILKRKEEDIKKQHELYLKNILEKEIKENDPNTIIMKNTYKNSTESDRTRLNLYIEKLRIKSIAAEKAIYQREQDLHQISKYWTGENARWENGQCSIVRRYNQLKNAYDFWIKT